ncbi:MAG: S8 family serine peptidase [Ignavibacteria bacterium]
MRLLITFIVLLYCSTIYSQIDTSKVVVTTNLSKQFFDKTGKPLTGKGIVIGDIDSGIDIFHPLFFFADGKRFNWVDVDGNRIFTPGVDGVDLNNNGVIDEDEILNYIEMKNGLKPFILTDSKVFNPDMDFLYVDMNKNGKRDYGELAGFTEANPTYGEPLFIAIDKNHNNLLDSGEEIVALKTSKIRAVREKDGTIRRRGIDLIKTEVDTIGHGTGVCGILVGGTAGIQKIHGIAPDAELVLANIKYDYTPRFVRQFPDMLRFLRTEKVDIVLFEDGEWAYEFMDGSTEEELLTNELAREGIIVVGGAGNLASGKMHIIDTLKSGKIYSYAFTCPDLVKEKTNDYVFISFLWKNPSNFLSFVIETPDGLRSQPVSQGADYFKLGDYLIYYSREISPRNTTMMKFQISKQDLSSIGGKWSISVKSIEDDIIYGFLTDVSQSWSDASIWISNKISDLGTVTFPSTADSCISVGAYVVNYPIPSFETEIGSLCYYSGRGTRLNGGMGVDVCAPGHLTFTAGKYYQYQFFSGTSSAAPHVAGLAALMKQYSPTLTHSIFRNILRSTSLQDRFTGDVPNPEWGYGKLAPEAALEYLLQMK